MQATYEASSTRPVSDTRSITPALYWGAMLAIVLVGLGLRIYNLDGMDMWTDEVLTAFRARAPLSDSMDSTLSAGNQAPLYYLIARLVPNDTQLLLRMPALLMGLAGIALLIHTVRWLYDDPVLGLTVGALLAVNPMHVILARTARFYMLLFLLSLATTVCFLLILRGNRSRSMWLLFAVSSMFAYLTHYSALALPATQFMIMALDRKTWPLLLRWIPVQIMAGFPFVMWVGFAVSSTETSGFLYNPQIPSFGDLPITYTNLVTGYWGEWTWVALPGIIIAGVGLAVGAIHLVRNWQTNREMFYWFLLGTVPIITLFGIGILLEGKYKDRYFVVSIPAVLLIFATGLQRLPQQWRTVALGIVLATGIYQTVDLYRSGDYQRTEWSDAANYVEANLQPGDNILFARWSTAEAFITYFDGDPALLETSLYLDATPDTAEFEARSERMWIIYRTQYEHMHRQGWVHDFDAMGTGISPMSDWLIERETRILDEYTVNGVHIYLVEGTSSGDS